MGRIVSFDEQRQVLWCAGDEDRATQGRRRCALSRALSAEEDVTVELADLGFADASLMVDLAMLARRLRRRGRALLLRCPQPHIHTLIELVGLQRMDGVHIVGLAGSAG